MASNADLQLPGAETTANELWFDALVRHQIFVLRMSGSLRNEMIALLNATESDVVNRIRARLPAGGALTPQQLRRAQVLIRELREIRGAAHDQIETLLLAAMTEFVVNEAKFAKVAFETAVPVQVDTKLPAKRTLTALVRDVPFEGLTLKQWARNMRAADLRRIDQQVRIGIVQGEDGGQIARRVVGTRALTGRDGVTQISRGDAAIISRTASIHFSNSAREEFLSTNSEFFTDEMYVATLDGRTTPICRSLDGRRFPVGEGPMPPIHMGCRSLRVAIILQEALGRRPTKPTTERLLVREFTRSRGIAGVGRRADLPLGTKGQFDQFSRRRVREMIGTVPAKVTYPEWLKTQSVAFQDDVLGKTKGRLFRRGTLPLTKFVNRRGDEIPLSQLARSDASAFRAAGLDPGDFR